MGPAAAPNAVLPGRFRRAVPFFSILISAALVLFNTGCKRKKPAPPPPPQVEVMTVTPRDVPIYKEWIGSVDGLVNAQIRAQVTGYLQGQYYKEGDQVKKGDMLFQIDPRPFQTMVEQAQARLAQDKAQFDRAKWDAERYAPLAKENAISQQEYNTAVETMRAAEALVKADQAVLENTKVNLGFTKITAPIDGMAGIAQAQIGDLVGPNGNPLTTISTINPVRVFFNVAEQAYIAYRRQYTNEVERAAHEQELELQLILADGSTYPYKGRFWFADRQVDPNTGTLRLVGLFPNPAYLLRPGQFARVRAQTEVRKGALAVPQRAVTELQGSYQIAVVDNQNKAHLVTVKVGDRVGSDWVIEQGLKPGERIVVEGTQKVKDGVPVNPKPFQKQQMVAMEGKQ